MRGEDRWQALVVAERQHELAATIAAFDRLARKRERRRRLRRWLRPWPLASAGTVER